MNRKLLTLMLAALMLLTLAACKSEEEPTITTFADVPAVMLVPDDFWDETQPESESTEPAKETEKPEETAPDSEKTDDPTTAPTTGAEQETTAPSAPAVQITEYEWYNALSGEEQMAYMESFDSMEAFFDWYNAAKAEYEELHPSIEVGDGNIDMGDLFGGNG